MAYSYHEVVASGGNTFLIPFDYIKAEEIDVYVDGVLTEANLDTYGVVDITPPPANGSLVRIERNTNLITRAVDFASGAVLTEEDLDNSFAQVFFAAQEAADKVVQTMRVEADGKWAADGRQIKGVIAPTANDHAVNLGFLSNNIGAITNLNSYTDEIEEIAGNMDNVNTVANNLAEGADSSINIVADNVSFFDNYADTYIISATQPLNVAEGTQWYNTANNTKYIFNGSTWQAYNSTYTSAFVGFKVEDDGSLIVEITEASDTANAEDYDDWFMAFSDASYSIDENGHLKVTY